MYAYMSIYVYISISISISFYLVIYLYKIRTSAASAPTESYPDVFQRMTERNVPHCTGASPAPKPVPNSLVTVASTPVLASRPVTVALDREVRGLTILLYQVGLKVPCAPK